MLHITPHLASKFLRQKTDWAAVTGVGGAFQFSGLPGGAYTLCPRVPNDIWLSPCEWNFPTPTATISRSNPNTSATIVVKRGVAVPIRIDDPGQLMEQNEGKTPGAGLLLGVASSGFFFRQVPLVSKDSRGRNYQIVVPFGVQLGLVVHPSFYHVNDANGGALSQARSTKIPLLVAAGQQVLPIHFTITGAGHQ